MYSCADSLMQVISELQDDLPIVLAWFKVNILAASLSKVPNISFRCTWFWAAIDRFCWAFLGIRISSHISLICHRASLKIRSLSRISPYLQQNQIKLLFNASILSTFNYAPLTWMFCNKSCSKKLDSIHKRALRIVYQDFTKSYEELLQISGYKRIHEVHISFLLCEVYKTVNGLNPTFMKSLFTTKPLRYQLRNCNLLVIPPARSSRNGNQSFIFRRSILWNTLPDCVKSKPTLNSFKTSLKALDLLGLCNCKLCSGIWNVYIIKVTFITQNLLV